MNPTGLPSAAYEAGVDLWCAHHPSAWRRGFWPWLWRTLDQWEAEGLPLGSAAFARDAIQEQVGRFIPDAWVVEAPEQHWALRRIVLLEVIQTSKIKSQKYDWIGNLFWCLDAIGVDLVVEMMKPPVDVWRVDGYDISLSIIKSKHFTLPAVTEVSRQPVDTTSNTTDSVSLASAESKHTIRVSERAVSDDTCRITENLAIAAADFERTGNQKALAARLRVLLAQLRGVR